MGKALTVSEARRQLTDQTKVKASVASHLTLPRTWAKMLQRPEWKPSSQHVANLRINRPKFETPQELENLIDDYCEECKGRDVVPTVNGLVLAIGFKHRQQLYDAEALGVLNSALGDLLQYARLKIEAAWEERLGAPKQAIGAIFWLKNHGWMDERSQRVTATVTHQVAGYWQSISEQTSAERATIEADCVTLESETE